MKPRLDRDVISMRVASELKDGELVNVGHGILRSISSYIPPDRDVVFHSENGVIGYGRVLTQDDPQEMMDYNLINASAQFIAPQPGMCFTDFAEIFALVWRGRLDTTVLGAYQVSEKGDLANWSLDPEGSWGSIGGAMDLALCARRVIIGMEHVDRKGRPKIVKKCTLPITAPKCVDLIVTDISVIEVTSRGLLLREVAPGWTVEEVQRLTEPRLIIGDIKEMQLS